VGIQEEINARKRQLGGLKQGSENIIPVSAERHEREGGKACAVVAKKAGVGTRSRKE